MKKKVFKKDWARILTGILLLLGLVISFTNINSTEPGFKNNWWEYSLIGFILVILYIIVYYYVKNLPNNEEYEKELSFFKTLLPTSLAILSLIYALSSGFFDIQKLNLEYEKNQIREQKKKDSIELSQIKKSLKSNQTINANLIKENQKLREMRDELRSAQQFLGPSRFTSSYGRTDYKNKLIVKINYQDDNTFLSNAELIVRIKVRPVGLGTNTNQGKEILSDFNPIIQGFEFNLNAEKDVIGQQVALEILINKSGIYQRFPDYNGSFDMFGFSFDVLFDESIHLLKITD